MKVGITKSGGLFPSPGNLFEKKGNSTELPVRGNNTGIAQGNGDIFQASYAKKTNMSLSMSATYTKIGVLKGSNGPIAKSIGPAFDLGSLKDLMNRLKDFANEQVDSLDDSLSPKEFLKKLVLDRLMHKDVTGFPSNDGQISFSSFDSFKLDFSLDYSGMMKWNGTVYQTEFHLEFHLEQQELINVSHGDINDTDLIKLNDKTVDTGRYLISFEDAASLKIFDKVSRLSTTIWGDPHVDLSDEDGRVNGEFSDLKKSSILTSLKLLDGTTVVIKAPDDGLIEEVDVFKGDRHIKGYGFGQFLKYFNGMDKNRVSISLLNGIGSFGKVDDRTARLDTLLSKSDLVSVGGDGNDWFDQKGNLIWGGHS